MAERLTKEERRTRAEGLTLKELEAQAGKLLPNRLEMRRRRRWFGRRRGGGGFVIVVGDGNFDFN